MKINTEKRIVVIVLSILCVISLLSGCSGADPAINDTPLGLSSAIAESTDISVSFFGDLLIHDTIYEAAKTNGGYDFANQYSDIAPYLKKADFVVGNLETTFSRYNQYGGWPSFNCPEQLTTAMRDVLGMSLTVTANNHCMDTGAKGLRSTIDVLDEAGLDHIGTYKNAEKQAKPYIADIKGVKLGFLNMTYGLNVGLSDKSESKVDIIDKDALRQKSADLRSAGADTIVAVLHWGVEYTLVPTDSQRELAKWIYDNTEIDVIIGHHPHVVEPIEEIEYTRNGENRKGIVAYSLGNFIGDQRTVSTATVNGKRESTSIYTNSGLIVTLYITKDGTSGDTSITKVGYTPTYIDKNSGASNTKFRVLNVSKAISDYKSGADPLITDSKYDTLKKLKQEYSVLVPQSSLVFEDNIA